jgi:hypothetical protein
MTTTEATQQSLDTSPPQPEVPSRVQHGFTVVEFLKLHATRGENDLAQIGFDLSLKLDDSLNDWLPERIRECFEVLREHDLKTVVMPNAIICTAELALVPQGDDRSLRMLGAWVEKVHLATIEEKGTGETRIIHRLSMRLMADIDDENWHFARTHFGHTLWLKWKEVQTRLPLTK